MAISIERLHELLIYDSDTGKLFWRRRPNARANWNTQYAGAEAFYDDGRGYKKSRIDGATCYAHQVAWALATGRWPENEMDHINHNPADNRLVNLRPVTHRENSRNLKKKKNNRSGVTGVSWCSAKNKWTAAIRINGRQKILGRFADFDVACAARSVAKKANGYHRNHGI